MGSSFQALDTVCTTAELWASVEKFSAWLSESGYASYDPYDIWGTRYGLLARRLYYHKHPLGWMMTAPVILMDMICPRLRGLFVKKDRFPTADAQLVLAFLNLHEVSQAPTRRSTVNASETTWLTKARYLANELLAQSVHGYSGYCWGYPFDWQNANGLMPKGTPHITATPYCYEAFTRLYDLTGEEHYLDVARSIATFVLQDLNDTATGDAAAAASYTPHDHGKVVNASAYRAQVLFDAARRFHDDAYRAKASNNLRFILQSQQPDGFWLYAIDSPAEAFIDHFHTCFVLKNLHKINRHLQSLEVEQAVRRGYEWYRRALFDRDDNPKSFAVATRLQIIRLDMYNVAEAISLGALLRDEIPEALSHSKTLAARLMRRYQLPIGHWITRVYVGGIRHKVPFLRWPQAQLFFAQTNLLAAMQHATDRSIDAAQVVSVI
jgi:hypothetical protein